MALRRITRFRKGRRSATDPSLLQRIQLAGGFTLVSVAALAIACLLVAAPIYWTARIIDQVVQTWAGPLFNQVDKIESHWMSLPRVPAFSRGDEPELRDFLASQPLIVALQERTGQHSLWVRQGDRLLPAEPTPEARLFRTWFDQAEAEHRFATHPRDPLPGEARSGPKIVLLGDRWIVAKCWREGSPQVERILRLVLGEGSRYRLGLTRPGDEGRKDLQPQAWGAEPNLQVDPARLGRHTISVEYTISSFQGWTLQAIAQAEDNRRLVNGLRFKRAMARAVSALIGACLALGLYLRRRAQQKAALDADRLASMTHSLKTPLAILKVRCDTIRLGRLSQDEIDAQLIRLGEEADRLSSLIENGLAAIQGQTASGPRGEVTPQWLEGIAEDLAPAFQSESRNLFLELSSCSGLAPLPSLRSGLLTLLENALYHGRGTVTLETARKGNRFTLKVSDQGPGLSAGQIKALGKPYLRLRDRGKEGFQREGQGLGLSLLCKVAEQEGWGLSFASEGGRGLTAVLEIPCAPAC